MRCGAVGMRALSPDAIRRVLHCAMANGNHAAAFPDTWEPYDMDADRTELHNFAEANPAQVHRIANAYRAWAERGARNLGPSRRRPAVIAAGYYCPGITRMIGGSKSVS